MTTKNLQTTKAEQYMDAVDQAMKALANDHLELASKHITTAQFVRYDLDSEVDFRCLR
jgi:hypothetical protein